ncbi:MAG: hypothetical protein AB7F53_06670 [Nitrososphaeraceae archaeon]
MRIVKAVLFDVYEDVMISFIFMPMNMIMLSLLKIVDENVLVD